MCLGVDSGKTTDSIDPKKVRCVKNGLFCHRGEYDEDRIFQAGVRRESSMFFVFLCLFVTPFKHWYNDNLLHILPSILILPLYSAIPIPYREEFFVDSDISSFGVTWRCCHHSHRLIYEKGLKFGRFGVISGVFAVFSLCICRNYYLWTSDQNSDTIQFGYPDFLIRRDLLSIYLAYIFSERSRSLYTVARPSVCLSSCL